MKAFAINRKTIPDSTAMVNRLVTNPELLEELGHMIKKSEFNHHQHPDKKENPMKSSSLERGKSLGNNRGGGGGSQSESHTNKNIKSSATMPTTTEMISLNSTGSLEKNSSYHHHRKQERKNSATKSETISSSASKADLVSGWMDDLVNWGTSSKMY